MSRFFQISLVRCLQEASGRWNHNVGQQHSEECQVALALRRGVVTVFGGMKFGQSTTQAARCAVKSVPMLRSSESGAWP